ncbi:DEAD/DEAH box helicase family protein [Staphylococcus auricularis]|nr:DEAD/DEAH box helicase family protein [Staphylococcus auricularis]
MYRNVKYYGKIITDTQLLTDEKIQTTMKGVIQQNGRYYCNQCGTTQPTDFYHYAHIHTGETIYYCRRCLALGRMDTLQDIMVTASHQAPSDATYQLGFALSEQQAEASNRIVEAVTAHHDLLIHAVTGAGKTEIIFQAIQYARQRGDNIAVISPRVDVIVEISMRIQAAFTNERIDVLYQGHTQQYEGHFVIATVHQLYRFKNHFDTVFVDEVDAFPLVNDEALQRAIPLATKDQASVIYMSATPPKQMIRTHAPDHYVILPARFHRHALPLPTFHYLKFNPQKIQRKLLNLLLNQIKERRFTLVFFNHIELMHQAFETYRPYIEDLICVYSEDALRLEKVAALRAKKHPVVFTTTILERGFTMAHLDVVVINSQLFDTAALIQIAGRVGRKIVAPTGRVWFFHQGISLSMLRAKRDIKHMNQLAKARGWIDD